MFFILTLILPPVQYMQYMFWHDLLHKCWRFT